MVEILQTNLGVSFPISYNFYNFSTVAFVVFMSLINFQPINFHSILLPMFGFFKFQSSILILIKIMITNSNVKHKLNKLAYNLLSIKIIVGIIIIVVVVVVLKLIN